MTKTRDAGNLHNLKFLGNKLAFAMAAEVDQADRREDGHQRRQTIPLAP